MANRHYENAVKHGFYEDYNRVRALLTEPKDIMFFNQIWHSHRLMLIVSELSEGLEAIRNNNYDVMPRTGGLGEELADTRIRLEDFFEHLYPSETFDAVVDEKADYNESRPYKHNRSL